MAKRTSLLVARETMQKFGYDPMEELVKLAVGTVEAPASMAVKQEIALSLLPYVYPKLSNVEIFGEIDQTNHAPDPQELLRRVLANPELADAAQMLSLEASDILMNASRKPN